MMFTRGQDIRLITITMILLVISFGLISGCGVENIASVNAEYIDSIADTLYSGESRTVFLSDGTGGFYFDDAFRLEDYGEYGFSYRERRLMAGWHITDEKIIDLTDDPLYCIVHPLRIQRYYASELVETVEMPINKTGIVISLRPPAGKTILFRPIFDFRRLDREVSGKYISHWHPEKQTLSISRVEDGSRWLAVSCPEGVTYRDDDIRHRFVYRKGELIGRPGIARAYSSGEFLIKGNKVVPFAVGYGNSEEKAVATAISIRDSLDILRSRRFEQIRQLLDKVFLRCDNKDFEKSFAWSRIVLSELIMVSEGERYLLTGIPFDPYPDGWQTCMAIPGLIACGFPPEEASDLLEGIIEKQNIDTTSDCYGMLPGAIREDSSEYRIPEIAGLAALALNRIKSLEVKPNYPRDERVYRALLRDIEGTARDRINNGLVTGEGGNHFLWDGYDAPSRSGAVIESQALFGAVREALKSYSSLDSISEGIPTSLITGTGGRKAITAGSPLLVVGKSGTYQSTVDVKSAMQFFFDPKKKEWADRVVWGDSSGVVGNGKPRLIFEDRLSNLLALYWFKAKDTRLIGNALGHAREVGLIGEVGFRTLAEINEEFQPAHLYLSEKNPCGSKSYGDVLLWSVGILADMMTVTGNSDEVGNLTSHLMARIIQQGITGALPEAEDGSSVTDNPNSVGNVVYATSTAEWIRIACDILIGLDTGSGPYISLRPRIPEEWGNFEVITKRAGGTIRLRRVGANRWLVYQLGIKPYLQLALETYPEPGERALGSLRVYPGGEAELEFIQNEDGRWTSTVERD